MLTSRKNFKGQFEDEVVLCFFRKHWIILPSRIITIAAGGFLIVLGLRYFVFLTSQNVFVTYLVLFAYVMATYLIHRQFLAIFRYFLHTVMITNYRIVAIDKSVFLRDSKDSVDLASVQDIQQHQNGFFENLLDYGTLVIMLSGTHASVNIDLVPRPGYQFKKINTVRQAVIEQRRFLQRPLDAFHPQPVESHASEEDYVELLEKAVN